MVANNKQMSSFTTLPPGLVLGLLTRPMQHCTWRALAAHAATASVPRFELTGFADSPIFADIAKTSKVAFLSPQLGKLLDNDKLRADAVHLNGDCHRALAANVVDEPRRLGNLRR